MKVHLFQPFVSDAWRGIERYCQLLASQLSSIEPVRPSESWLRGGRRLGRRVLYPWHASRLAHRASETSLFHVADQSFAQLLHALPPERSLITCHDLEFWHRRSAWNAPMRRHLLHSLRRAAAVVCPSATVAKELRTLLPGIEPRVIENSVAPAFHRPAKVRAPSRVLLHVGDPGLKRKNVDFVLGLLKELNRRAPTQLIQVGGPWTDAQQGYLAREGLHAKIEKYQRVEDAELIDLYDRADIVLIPSLEEGFGYPLVEAAARGRAFVANDLAVFAELCGPRFEADRVALDSEAWRARIEALFIDPGPTQVRTEWSKRFSSEANTRAYEALYAEISASSSSAIRR